MGLRGLKGSTSALAPHLLHGKFVADGRVVESGLDGLQHRTDCVTQRLLLLQNPQHIFGQLLQICSRRRPRTKQKKYTKLMQAQSELMGTAPWIVPSTSRSCTAVK